MSGAEPADTPDREPAVEDAIAEPVVEPAVEPVEDTVVDAAVEPVSTESSEVSELGEVGEVGEEAGSSEVSQTPESVETVGTAAASGSADGWASPDGAAQAAPTVAVPIGARPTCVELAVAADAVVCPWAPADFRAVSQGYADFSQTSDDEVRRLLAPEV